MCTCFLIHYGLQKEKGYQYSMKKCSFKLRNKTILGASRTAINKCVTNNISMTISMNNLIVSNFKEGGLGIETSAAKGLILVI
ncbi:hypothetical protein BOW55_18365 [Flavobacterium sp. YO12]|nr:hypothetical protein BOW55_18365 [Flavobacterium sp. YO12]